MKWPAKLLVAFLSGIAIVLIQMSIPVLGDNFILMEDAKLFRWGFPLTIADSGDPNYGDPITGAVLKAAFNALFWTLCFFVPSVMLPGVFASGRAVKVCPCRGGDDISYRKSGFRIHASHIVTCSYFI